MILSYLWCGHQIVVVVYKTNHNLSAMVIDLGIFVTYQTIFFMSIRSVSKSLYGVGYFAHFFLVCLFVLLLYVPSKQLWSWRDGQFT